MKEIFCVDCDCLKHLHYDFVTQVVINSGRQGIT